jgi:hypothetical protein
MNVVPQAERTPLQTLWLAVRFVVFGVGGFVLLMASWFVVFGWFGGERWMNPFFALLLATAAAGMMLFGSGQWGRWQYLWVFLSMPITVSALMLLISISTIRFATRDFLDPMWDTPLVLLWYAAPMPITYLLVRRYYRMKDARANP